MNAVIKADGMMCNHCKARVEKVCKGIAGVADAVVSLQDKTVTITGEFDVNAVKQAINEAGYKVME